MRGDAAASDSCEASACFSARSRVRSTLSLSSCTFSLSTATLSATTPASRIATNTIQTTPPATPRRACGFRFRAGARRRCRRGLDGGAQPGRGGARVGGDFLRCRPDRPARLGTQRRLVPADADGEVRRAGATALLRAEEPLHDPVLERVEADHGEAPARPEQLQGGRQCGFQRAELIVHGDPQRLEDTFGGMAVAETRGRGDRSLDRLHELAGALKRPLAAATADRAGDLARVALLAVVAEDRGQVALA